MLSDLTQAKQHTSCRRHSQKLVSEVSCPQVLTWASGFDRKAGGLSLAPWVDRDQGSPSIQGEGLGSPAIHAV